ncbi:copper amine oxidase N-terminal domain-containing protein [Paenibacillus sp. Z6-24]
MKNLIAASIAAGLLLSSTPTYASPVSITTPDQQTIKGSDVQTRQGRTLIPIRDLARAIDATLVVDSAHHKVTLKKWGEVYTFTIGKARYRVNRGNDPTSELTVPVQQIKGRTYIPVITWQAHLPQNSSDVLKDFLNFKLKDKWGSVPVKNTDYLYNMHSYLGDSSTSITGIVHANGGYNQTGYEYEVGGDMTDAGGKLSFVMPGEQRTD